MTLINHFWLITFVCLSGTLFAQDLHIHFDAQTSTIRYVLNGKEINSPKVKKDGNIFLHVENYNNYLYDLEIKANNQVLQIPSGSGVGSFLSLMGGGGITGMLNSGDFSSGAGSGWQNLNDMIGGGGSQNDDEEEDDFGFAKADEEDVVQSAGKLLQLKAVRLMEEMESTEQEFIEIEKELRAMESAQELREIVLEEVNKVKYNENLNPDQVQRMSLSFLERILDINDKQTLDLDAVIAKGNDRQKLEEKMDRLEKNKKAYEEQVIELKSTGDEMKVLDVSGATFFKFLTTIGEVSKKSEEVLKTVKAEQEKINSKYAKAGKEAIQKMTSIWYEYEAMSNNSFSYTYRTEAMGDRTVLGINFYKKDSSGNRLPASAKVLTPIKVPVYGGLKVNVSVGLNFGQYFTRPQSYFLSDSILLSEDSDGFIPMATSFVHFYPQRINDVSLGGSFGIGIPLTGADGVSSINFFLGPSLIIGKSQRIALNAGFMGGRVKQLSQGLEVGDVVPLQSAIPTANKYKLGYFLGVSFNINGT